MVIFFVYPITDTNENLKPTGNGKFELKCKMLRKPDRRPVALFDVYYPIIHELESAYLFKEIISCIMTALHLQNSDNQLAQLFTVLNQRFQSVQLLLRVQW